MTLLFSLLARLKLRSIRRPAFTSTFSSMVATTRIRNTMGMRAETLICMSSWTTHIESAMRQLMAIEETVMERYPAAEAPLVSTMR